MAKSDRTRPYKGGVKDTKETRVLQSRGARRVGVDPSDLRRRDARAEQNALAREALAQIRGIKPGAW